MKTFAQRDNACDFKALQRQMFYVHTEHYGYHILTQNVSCQTFQLCVFLNHFFEPIKK